MHCDITGFTAMSESLARMGKEGAEIMARCSTVFRRARLSLSSGGEQ
jgi:hypothetical protein